MSRVFHFRVYGEARWFRFRRIDVSKCDFELDFDVSYASLNFESACKRFLEDLVDYFGDACIVGFHRCSTSNVYLVSVEVP